VSGPGAGVVDRHSWEAQLRAASDVPNQLRFTALMLAGHIDAAGRMRPGMGRLARELGVERSTARRHVGQPRRCGRPA
jgi:hypothetical protein